MTTSPGQTTVIDERRLRELVPMAAAVDELEAALREGAAPGATPPRSSVPAVGGELLVMPAAHDRYVGVKLVSVAPGNAARQLPRVQGVYVLFDATTLSPVAIIDGVALTSLRTPAVSAIAVRHLAVDRPVRLVVIGTGPQAFGHVEAVQAVRPVEHLTVAARDVTRAEALAAWSRDRGATVDVVAAGASSAPFERALRAADVVVCATTAREPLFDGRWVPDDATVVAVGSHEPQAREVDEHLVLRSTVVVETRATALREAGDLLVPIAAGHCGPEVISGDLADLVAGRVPVGAGRPRLFKSCGEAWQDLVVAGAALDRAARILGTDSDPKEPRP